MYRLFLKHVFDLVFSLLALPFWFIIFIVISPLIYFEDKGSIFYNAPRLGKNGRIFKMYKFRTMKMNVPDLRNEDGSTFNSEDDPRLTKIGKFLRKTSLDETPQLLNVIKGDMSIVGPRPDLTDAFKIYSEDELVKLNEKPGITGYNQAFFRNSISVHERIKNDVFYVNNIGFLLDLRILLATAHIVFRRDGVYAVLNNKEVKHLSQ